MAKKRGTKLPTLTPGEWVRILGALGVFPRAVNGPHTIYDIPDYPAHAGSGQPYIVDANWPGIPRKHIRLILRLCRITEERFWEER